MQSSWSEPVGAKDDLDIRVHTSRLLGEKSDLVLHGGGNTSVKSIVKNIFGEDEEILFVKGSGWDLATIARAGFAPVKMQTLLKLAELETLSDTDMVNSQRAAMINPNAPTPSIEAILHAILPFKFVDHTHADAVVTVTNTPKGEEFIKEIYGDSVIIIPYVMPGFILAKEIAKHIKGRDLSNIDALILMNHGVFTFDDDAKKSYEKMIAVVDKAEQFIAKSAKGFNALKADTFDALQISKIRKKASEIKGSAMIIKYDDGEISREFASRPKAKELASVGPLTPDHVIRTKQKGVFIDSLTSLDEYAKEYEEYFKRNNDGTLTMLDRAPRWGVVNGATISFGQNVSDANIIHDIKEHTLSSILNAKSLCRYETLSEAEIFKMEYWELEQAKLKKGSFAPEFSGKIVLITGGASGIGKACVEQFVKLRAAVVALDINPAVESMYKSAQILGIACDLTKKEQIDAAIKKAVKAFGGIDILVNSAEVSNIITTLVSPFLKSGIDPAIVYITSTDANSEILSLPPEIRINTIYSDKVFDTAVCNNIADLACAMAGKLFSKVNGAKLVVG
ncbi:MAG: hypothetical protein RL154_570 [Pseudomonadota bacterium]|jgi:rhamnose utilization protein RhaD (predicted bifunctional aldolase and dehydrogenase)